MAFNPNIPIISDLILKSSKQLRANFQAINQSFSVNHAGLTQNPNISGMHNAVVFRPQLADPTTAADQVALYNKIVSSVPQLFYRPNNSQTPIQLTFDSIKVDGSDTQYSFVAGPFIVYGGFRSAIKDGTVITLTPGTTLLYVDLTLANKSITLPNQNTYQAVPTAIAGTSFTVKYQTGITQKLDLYYFAIGI